MTEEPAYSYEINPRRAEVGGGWHLRLLEHDDALAEASVWLASRGME